ncbi:MAG: hypothetical protein CM15mP48_1310 [Candidatus Poseidoniales archaeon]|nr:MAG: hypothetical protein CM15mP48_1310 [Candidatus Poseidoniales archaeon]
MESKRASGAWDSLSTDGVRSGLDIEYCKAIAAAIGLDPMTQIEWIPASSQDRFEKLASEEIDVLIRTNNLDDIP